MVWQTLIVVSVLKQEQKKYCHQTWWKIVQQYFVFRLQPIMWNHVGQTTSRKFQMRTKKNCMWINKQCRALKIILIRSLWWCMKWFRSCTMCKKKPLIDLRRATFGTGNYRMLLDFCTRFVASVERCKCIFTFILKAYMCMYYVIACDIRIVFVVANWIHTNCWVSLRKIVLCIWALQCVFIFCSFLTCYSVVLGCLCMSLR